MLAFIGYQVGAAIQACLLVLQHRAHFDGIARNGKGFDAAGSCKIFLVLTAIVAAASTAAGATGNAWSTMFVFTALPVAVLLPLVFAALLSNDLLPEVNEHMLLTVTITFWSAYAPLLMANPDLGDEASALLVGIPAVPTAAVLVLAFSHVKVEDPWRFVFYSWYLVALAATAILQIPLLEAVTVVNAAVEGSPAPVTPMLVAEGFLFGGACTFIATRALPLHVWITWIPGKKESWGQSLRRARAQARLLASHYSPSQLGLPSAATILVVQGGLVAGNILFDRLPPALVTCLSVTIVPQILERWTEAEARRAQAPGPLDPAA